MKSVRCCRPPSLRLSIFVQIAYAAFSASLSCVRRWMSWWRGHRRSAPALRSASLGSNFASAMKTEKPHDGPQSSSFRRDDSGAFGATGQLVGAGTAWPCSAHVPRRCRVRCGWKVAPALVAGRRLGHADHEVGSDPRARWTWLRDRIWAKVARLLRPPRAMPVEAGSQFQGLRSEFALCSCLVQGLFGPTVDCMCAAR